MTPERITEIHELLMEDGQTVEDVLEIVAALRAAQLDSERLKAMIENSWRIVALSNHKDGLWHVWGPEGIYGPRFGVGNTPHEALDKARASLKEQS